MPNARVSAFTRWNNAVVESRKASIDYVALDNFRQEVLSQEELYEDAVRPFVNRCLQGCSGSIITYGAWGSGKSYTLGTLDPQQLTLDTRGNEAAGLLPRCTRELYEWLGQGASVEITCVEVQGDEVVDLLDQRAGPAAFSRPAAADHPFSSICSSSGGGPGPGGAPVAHGAFTRSPMAVAAAGAAAGSRRKPLSMVVARSLSEALLALKRAVSNRQAFVTATRHSSSRTHAVFQLRWRNPAAPAAGGSATSIAARASPQVSVGGTAQRAYSAPPRASLPTGPPGCPAFVAAGGRTPPGGGAGPVCTLTLVVTCSYCPLLPPKEASAVKRSLLALSRVLSALQRRHPLTLRESKLTRMLEGSVDQVLVVACLCGSGDESTAQLVKMLQQGVPRDSALRRSRRASSSDSTRISAAWETTPHSSVFSVSAVRLASNGGTATAAAAPPPHRPATAAAKGAYCSKASGPLLGPGPGRSTFRSPGSPLPPPAHGVGNGARPVVTARTTVCLHVVSLAAEGSGMDGGGAGGGSGRTSSGGGTGTDADPAAAAPFSSSSLEVSSSSSPAASSRSADSGDGDVVAAAAATVLPSAASPPTTKAVVRPALLTIDVIADTADELASPDGAAAAHESRLGMSPGDGSSGGRRASSSAASPAGPAPATFLSRMMSPRVASPRQKPPSVTARAAPSPEVRRSQGFSVLAGKWAPPPATSPRDTGFPVLPCIMTPRDGASASASSQRSSRASDAAAASTDIASSLTVSERPPGGGCRDRPSPRATSAPVACEQSGMSSAAAELNCSGGRDAATETPSSGGAGSGDGFRSPFAAAARGLKSYAVVTSTVDPPNQTTVATLTSPAAIGVTAASSGSPASAGSTPARRKSGIPARPPVRSPQPAAQSPFAAATTAGLASPAPRPTYRPAARSPPPVAAATVVSLAAVRPTRLVSMRYGSANVSRDSAPGGSSAAVSAAASAISALLAVQPAVVPPASLARMSLHRRQQPAAAADPPIDGADDSDGITVRVRGSREAGDLAALKRSISSGLRWPSPLLRARRTEWLSDMRRSRSAISRPLTKVLEPAGGSSGASPHRLRHGFRCAAVGHPTLSAQYKDLLLDFEAFRTRERLPRQRRSALGGTATPITSAASAPPTSTRAPSGPTGNRSPDPRCGGNATISPAAPDLLAPGYAPKLGPPMPARGSATLSSSPSPPQHGAVGLAAVAAPLASSPAVSTGLPAVSSPASISTPHSARPASGSYIRPPSAFSRAHSPSADEGLLSLTAAAAVAAASPRTPASGGTLPSARPRPGVSRAAGATASPRPMRSPENPVTPVSPVTVIDMSRLFTAKGSPTVAAATTQPPGSGRSRLSASSLNVAAAAGHLASGGSDRYRRLIEDDADSDRASAAGADPDPDLDMEHGYSDAGSDRNGGSDLDRDNLLGPGCLGHLGLILDSGGDVSALRSSISRLGDSGRASPSVAGGGGAAATTATPSPLRRASAATEALCSWPMEGYSDGLDEELPAVSFFIHQFSPRAEVRDVRYVDGAVDARRPAAEVEAAATPHAPPGESRCCANRSADALQPKQEAAEEAVARTGAPQPEPEQQQPQQEQAQRLRAPMRQAATGIRLGVVAAAAAAAMAELQVSYTSQDRASVESGVLRGSCTPFAVDAEGTPATATSSAGGHGPPPPPPAATAAAHQAEVGRQQGKHAWESQPRAGKLGDRDWEVGSRGAVGREESAEGGGALGPPSESSISLRQLLQQQEKLLLLQQRLAQRLGGTAAAAAHPGEEEKGQVERRLGGSGGVPSATLAANALLAQLAHVRPNHFDLDEQSTVLVDMDSVSESDVVVEAARRNPASAHRSSRPSSCSATAGPAAGSPAAAAISDLAARRNVAAASPSRPSAPMPEPPAAIRTPSPMKPSPSLSPLQAQQRPAPLSLSHRSSVRDRIAALEAAMSPVAGATGSPRTPPRLLQSWTDDGSAGVQRSPAASAPVPAAAESGGTGVTRRGSMQARSSPSPSAAAAAKAMAVIERKTASGGGPVLQHRTVLRSGGAGHARQASDGAVGGSGGAGAGGSTALRRGSVGRTAAAAASPPRSPPPPVKLARSIDADGGAARRSSTLLSSPLPAPPSQHSQPHQQQLRGSGNVAAAWRAAAAMSTSSSSSVRSCFRSSSGQQQQQAQHNLLSGSDATAVATVVALSRVSPSCWDDKQYAGLARTSGHATTTTTTAAVKLGCEAGRLQSARSSGTVPIPAAAVAAATPATAPPLPPAAPNPFAMHAAPPGPKPPPCVPPLALPLSPAAIDAGSAAPPAPLLAKAKSARGERSFPLAARLRACKSYRTPRAAPPATDVTGGAALETQAEAAEPPPPAAYPPGFVTWATKLFSGSKKNKQPC